MPNTVVTDETMQILRAPDLPSVKSVLGLSPADSVAFHQVEASAFHSGSDLAIQSGGAVVVTGQRRELGEYTPAVALGIGDTATLTITADGRLTLADLPTTDPKYPGQVWSDRGYLRVSI